MPDRRAYAYVRLSRADHKEPGTTEEKLAVRRAICRDLAKQTGVVLRDEDIVTEVQSGESLAKRDGLRAILRAAAAGGVSHLITPQQDRLTRGSGRDVEEIKDALCLGRVTLITTSGQIVFDERFEAREELVFDIQARVAQQYNRDLVLKRRDANRQRLRENRRSSGIAPYGYRTVKAPRDRHGRQIPPTDADVAEGRASDTPHGREWVPYEIIEDEFEVVRQIYAWAPTTSYHAIVQRLFDAGVPSPRGRPSWTPQQVKSILRNPIYAGRHSQGTKTVRGRLVRLNERVVSETEGVWPVVLTFDSWLDLQAMISSRTYSVPRSDSVGILSGLLYCCAGQRMYPDGRNGYRCHCQETPDRPAHRGTAIAQERIERYAKAVVERVIMSVPDAIVTRRAKRTHSPHARLASATRSLSDAERSLADLIANREYHVGLFGKGNYEQAAARVAGQVDKLKAQVEALRQEAASPSMDDATPLLAALRGRISQVSDVWTLSDLGQQRALVASIVRRMTLVEPGPGRRTSAVRLDLWDWARPYLSEEPVLERIARRRL